MHLFFFPFHSSQPRAAESGEVERRSLLSATARPVASHEPSRKATGFTPYAKRRAPPLIASDHRFLFVKRFSRSLGLSPTFACASLIVLSSPLVSPSVVTLFHYLSLSTACLLFHSLHSPTPPLLGQRFPFPSLSASLCLPRFPDTAARKRHLNSLKVSRDQYVCTTGQGETRSPRRKTDL